MWTLILIIQLHYYKTVVFHDFASEKLCEEIRSSYLLNQKLDIIHSECKSNS